MVPLGASAGMNKDGVEYIHMECFDARNHCCEWPGRAIQSSSYVSCMIYISCVYTGFGAKEGT